MDGDTDMVPSSPTCSSLSSSDLDTASSASFFPDRSTSLGTLMGVAVPIVSQSHPKPPPSIPTRRRRTRWWMLCREEDMARRTSLGDFLQVERRLSCADIGFVAPEHESVGGGPLFQDGRVLPPPPRRGVQRDGGMPRLPVLLAGICTGGEG